MFKLPQKLVRKKRQWPGMNGRSPEKMEQETGKIGLKKEGRGKVLADMPREA